MRAEDLKEIAQCGMKIHYTVDKDTDFVTYNDINDRGKYNEQPACEHCSWRTICKPTPINYMEIIREQLGKAVDPLDVITQIYEQAAAGVRSEIIHTPDGGMIARVEKLPYRWEDAADGSERPV